MKNEKTENIFKVGDKVYDITYGWGVVINIYTGVDYSVEVNFDTYKSLFYTSDGRYRMESQKCLSFVDYSGTTPFSQKRPKFIPNQGDWVWVRSIVEEEWFCRMFSHMENDTYRCYTEQRTEGNTTRWKFCIPFSEFPPNPNK